MRDVAEKDLLAKFYHTLPPLTTYVPSTPPAGADIPKQPSTFQAVVKKTHQLATPGWNESVFRSRTLTSSLSAWSILLIKVKIPPEPTLIFQRGMGPEY
ncbi:hypothetical protein BT96DRAFT_916367 [Gymnopus androsaceus JB14]|uniref:Uncharacterized protein n=1 Tax=Gymnopus androsaceus JB14 TaxID=1447944 RepID=A0A6A4I371_9AGAR|nr:hypothetical protein BT96DRAFT_916367 [Gymnopus androsaceus JB14]